jgi:hypothetical protein
LDTAGIGVAGRRGRTERVIGGRREFGACHQRILEPEARLKYGFKKFFGAPEVKIDLKTPAIFSQYEN